MDERCMLIWIEQIFVPYLRANPPPPGIQPVILLNAYQCHIMKLVVSKITALGVEVLQVLGGCTGLCQPLEVGINKPFKHHVCHLWEEWVMDNLDTDNKISEATCKAEAAWTAEVFWDMMGKKMLKNLWGKMGYNCSRVW
jgi:hypothetical protein